MAKLLKTNLPFAQGQVTVDVFNNLVRVLEINLGSVDTDNTTQLTTAERDEGNFNLGQIIYNTTTTTLQYWDGSTFQDISALGAINLNVSDGTTGITINLNTETLSLIGGTGITSTASGNSVTFAIDSTVATLTGTQTLTNKTLTSPTLNGDLSAGDAFLDEDNMASNDATKVASQQSIKAYVDSQIGANNELSEVLANGNTTGGTDIAVSANDDITFTDSSKAIFGTGSDLKIYHDGSNSYIQDSGTGNLRIAGQSVDILNPDANEFKARFVDNGRVELYYDAVKKLETTSTGIDVTGAIGLTDSIFAEQAGNYTKLYANNGEVKLFLGGADQNNYYDNNGHIFRARNTANELMRINTTGVGIGTTSPSAKLDVVGTVDATNYTLDFAGGSVRPKLTRSSASGGLQIATDGTVGNTNSLLEILNSSTSRVSVLGNGNVGINETSPASRLHITGTDGAWDKHITIEHNASDIGKILVDTDGMKFRNMSSGNGFYFRDSSNATQMLIDSSGNVGIAVGSNPATRLDVGGNVAISGIEIITSSRNLTNIGTISAAAITTSAANQDIDMDGSASGQISIDGNGYKGAIALGSTTMAIYNNSGSKSLTLGTNETARIIIGAGGGVNFNSNNLTSVGTISSGAITSSGLFTHNGTLTGTGVVKTLKYNSSNSYRLDTEQLVSSGLVKWTFNQVNNSTAYNNTLTFHNGNIAIGQASAATKLDVNGNIGISGTEVISSSRNLVNIGTISSGAITSSAGVKIASENALIGGGASGGDTQLIFWNGTNAYYGRSSLGGSVSQHEFRSGGTTKLTVNSSGIDVTGDVVADGIIVDSGGTWASSAGGLQLDYSSPTGFVTTYYDSNSLTLGAGVTQKTGITINGHTSGDGSSIEFRTGNSETARFDSSGRLGIGTSSPASNLHVDGSTGIIINDTNTASTTKTTFLPVNLSGNSQLKIKGGNFIHSIVYETSWNDFEYARLVSSYNAGDTRFDLNKSASDGSFASRTRISTGDSYFNANVGIGTTSPSEPLHVKTTGNTVAKYETSLTSDLAIQLANSQGSMYFGLGGGEEFAVATDSDLNGSGNLFAIKQDGKVGIGEITPLARLHIRATGIGANASTYSTAIIESTDAQVDITSSSDGTWGSGINLREMVSGSSTYRNAWSIVRKTGTGGSLNFNFGTGGDHNPSNIKASFNTGGSLDTLAGYSVGTTQVIDSSRNIVNVGTYSGSGNISVTTASSPSLALQDTTNNVIFKSYAQDSNAFTGTTSNHTLNIGTNNTAAITLDNSQNATFAGTISSGAITSSGLVTADELSVTNDSTFNGGIDATGQTITSGAITSTGSSQFATLTVTGDLTVQGTTTWLDSTNTQISDKNIVLNYSTGDSSANANGAGITIQDAVNSTTDATLLWDSTNDKFDFSHSIQVPDNANVKVGSAGDLFMVHNGSNSFIQNKVGDFYLENAADDRDIIFRSDDGAGGLAEYIRIDGSITETTFSKTTKVIDNFFLGAGTSTDLYMMHDGTNSHIINNTGDLTIRNNSDDKNIYLRTDDGLGGTVNYVQVDGNAVLTKFLKDTKHLDNVKATFGDSADLQIYHESSTSNSYISEGGAGNLYISANNLRLTNFGITESYLQADANGAVTLYYDGSAKLATTSTGIDVTGAIQLNGTNFAFESGSGTYHQITDPTARTAIFLGGSDEGNYYDNNNHYIRTRASSNLVQVNSNGLYLHTGTYRVGTTTVIDSSRNLTNIGTVSSGAITSTGSSTFDRVTDNNKKGRYTSLTGSSGDWFPILNLSNASNGPVFVSINTYAHSGATFTASTGYTASNSASLTVLTTNYNTNSGYANLAGLRIRSNGVVEAKLVWTTGPSVDIDIYVTDANQHTISFPASLATTTDTNTVQDSHEWSVTGLTSARKLNALNAFSLGGTTVVDSSRNLTNIGTISSGAISSSGDVTITSATPKIALVDNTADSDFSITNVNGNFRVYDDTNAITRFEIGSTGTTTVEGNLAAGNSTSSRFLRAHHSDGSFMSLFGYGLIMNRSASYIRPSTDHTDTLYIGGFDASTNADWLAIKFRSDNGLSMNGTQFITSARNLVNIGTISSGAITASEIVLSGTSDEILTLNSTDDGPVYMAYKRSNDRHAYVGFGGSGDVFNIMNEESGGSIQLGTAGTAALTIDSSQDATFAGDITLGANGIIDTASGHLIFKGSGATQGQFTSTGFSVVGNTAITGNFNTSLGGYQINGTTVIDSSRNLTNINTLELTGGANYFKPRDINWGNYSFLGQTGSGAMTILGHNAFVDTTTNNTVKAKNSGWTASFIKMYYSQGITFHTTSGTVTAGDTLLSGTGTNSLERLKITSGGDIQIKTGNLQIGSTTVIDSSRNLTNIGTISSGAITSSSTIATGSFTLPNSSGTAGQVLRYPSSGSTLVWEDDNSGLISAITNFSDNRVLTASGSDSINGESQLTFDGTTLAIRDAVYITNYTSADTDITGLVTGSTFGGLIQGDDSGHLVIGLRENGSSDSFAIVSGGGDYTTDTTYDTLAFKVDALGNTTVGGQLTTGDKIYLTSVASSGADGILAYDSTSTTGSRVFSFTRASSNELRYHSYGFHKWWTGPASGTADSTARMTLDGSGNLDLITGGLEINGTEVIDTSRNIKAVDVNLTGSIQNTTVPAEASVKINENGYADGTTYFRDLDIFDGKGNQFVKFDGSTQRVGIGTASPITKTHIKGDGLTVEESSAARKIQIIPPASGVDSKIRTHATSAGFIFQNNPSGDGSTFVDLVHIAGSAQVEISNPTSEVDTLVIGRNSGNASISGGTGDGAYMMIDSNGQYASINHYSSDDVALGFGGGSVGIGTVSPSARLQIEEYGIDTTETSTSATTQVAVDTFASATFRSARYTVQVTNSTDSTYHMTEILLIHDGTTPSITEYGTIFTGASAEATFDADISSGNVRLLATPASTDSMEFKVVRHCITT